MSVNQTLTEADCEVVGGLFLGLNASTAESPEQSCCSWGGVFCKKRNRVKRVTKIDLRFISGLEGTIGEEVGRLTELQTLRMPSTSRLTGTLPGDLTLLTELKELTVPRTKLSGTIPEGTGAFAKLETMN